ncbi:putative bifunctional diguanylate cyclase/phosphodiesterase [Geobacter pickeringii]|uniref:Diguanylate cyclase n=1 Tax=Geobacter pickeringii TaxID=345632 RepID=A0A0B5B7M2_9BACT|nr:EAL domain-containing protein [Geobacter pickeringii]AJE02572.1 diguanylate cyclase [Geobacter pickeringii]
MKTQERSIARITTILAAIITVAVSVLAPAGYFLVSYQYMVGSLDTQAEINARAVTQLVMANPQMWRYEEVRLMALLERRARRDLPEVRRVLDSQGKIIAESADPLRAPAVSRRHAIYDAGTPVAQIEISCSLRPLLLETTLVAAGAILLGGLGFIILRTIPLRAVQKAHHSLAESEAKYRSLYESMKEGMALYRFIRDGDGNPVSFEVVDINPSCESILGMGKTAVVGRRGAELFGGAVMDFFVDIVRGAQTGEALTFELPLPEKNRFFDVSVFYPEEGLFATLFEDVTERKKSDAQIQRLAYYDTLTGLPNRTLFFDRLNQALAGASRRNGKVALLFIDLDGFKLINDNLGHAQGDLLLMTVAQRLGEGIRRSDTLARLGGDEFMVLISSADEDRNAAQLAQHLLERISPPCEIGGRDVYTSASIGISIFPDDGRDVETLVRCADMAMYAAKEAGRNGYHFHSGEMNRKAHERMELEMSLRQALDRHEFFLEFQPIINARGDCLVGAEALVRWQHPVQGRIMPGTFIPAAENSGMVIPLGEWVLRNVCEKVREWRNADLPPVKLSVNVSGRQFEQRDFTAVVHGILKETGVDARSLQLELTETSLMKDADAAVSALHKLKELDLRIAVDDFGTGYSSLGYLRNFPIDHIKIDRSFVMDICDNPDDRSIVEAIVAMANKLNLNVVAEGVETVEQRDFLLNLGCHEMQGFLFHRPMPEEQFVELLRGMTLCATPTAS